MAARARRPRSRAPVLRPRDDGDDGEPLYWDQTNCIEVVPNAAGSDDMAPYDAFVAIDEAAENWNGGTAECSFMTLVAGEPSAGAVAETDPDGPNRNVIVWLEDSWPAAYPGTAAAITTLRFVDDADSAEDGRIIDADIELNGASVRFGICQDEDCDRMDLENTLTHELGHLLGMDHTCGDPLGQDPPLDDHGQPVPSCIGSLPAEIAEATMFPIARPGDIFMRSPSQDDIDAICETYPAVGDPGVCNEPEPVGKRSGCSMIPGSRQPAEVWMVVLVVALGALRRRALTT